MPKDFSFSTRPGTDEILQPNAAAALASDYLVLQKTIVENLRELARCETVLFCSTDLAGVTFTVTAASGKESADSISLPARGRLIRWLEVNATCLPVPDHDGVLDYLTQEERQCLTTKGARLCIPALVGDRAVALLLFCGPPEWRLSRPRISELVANVERIALACDSAARYQAQQMRLREKHRAEQLMVAGQLAAGIAHEVRNPLSTIRSSIQYAIDARANPDSRLELLQQALTEVDRIDESIDGMLSLKGPSELRLSDVDVCAIVSDAARIVQTYARAAQVRLSVQRLAPLVSRCDGSQLRQVFVNILLNACQAMPTGGTVVATCTRESMDADGASQVDCIVIRIKDSGPGVPLGLRERVLEPFFTTKQAGTGLGLPICLEIVKRHAGRLALEFPPEGGTVVVIVLPLARST